jgi:hypothetical protein
VLGDEVNKTNKQTNKQNKQDLMCRDLNFDDKIRISLAKLWPLQRNQRSSVKMRH